MYNKVSAAPANRKMLRFITAGGVDDGKSTLIGRLLYDSKSIFEDQMEHIVRSGKRLGRRETDLSLLTDGLRAEREQGITIDVAYRYFSTPKRKFIIADAPGHVQYTRNMVTGASTADAAVILVNSQTGAVEQTARHLFIVSLLGIKHVVFCINKMDIRKWSEECFRETETRLFNMANRLYFAETVCIPISAKYGDNVVDKSANMPWYRGKTFLETIEDINIKKDDTSCKKRFPVQTVIRPDTEEYNCRRRYAGMVAGGTFRRGDAIVVLPSMQKSKIKSIDVFSGNIDECTEGESVAITLEDDIDVSRGCMIVGTDCLPSASYNINAVICWFNERPPKYGVRYVVRSNTNETRCIIKGINCKFNVNTLGMGSSDNNIVMNDIADIDIITAKPLFFDSYTKNRTTGSLILIDEATNETVAAGMIS
ncbi:MAG: sulfate adenylyltransferase [Bacteroidales bacterium]|jgi:sulfate adenylyltransferase subunit 1|nr:sulfate adenylyltransferase [Bacteroidales bacterium]